MNRFDIKTIGLCGLGFGLLVGCGNSGTPTGSNGLPAGWEASLQVGRVEFGEVTNVSPLGQNQKVALPQSLKNLILKEQFAQQATAVAGPLNYLFQFRVNGQPPKSDVAVEIEGSKQQKDKWTLFSQGDKARSWWSLRFAQSPGEGKFNFRFKYDNKEGTLVAQVPPAGQTELPAIQKATLTENSLYLKWKKTSFAKSYSVILMQSGINQISTSTDRVVAHLVLNADADSLMYEKNPENAFFSMTQPGQNYYVAVVANQWDQRLDGKTWSSRLEAANTTVSVALLNAKPDARAYAVTQKLALTGKAGQQVAGEVEFGNMEGAADLLYQATSEEPGLIISDPLQGRLLAGQRVHLGVQMECSTPHQVLTKITVRLLNDPRQNELQFPVAAHCLKDYRATPVISVKSPEVHLSFADISPDGSKVIAFDKDTQKIILYRLKEGTVLRTFDVQGSFQQNYATYWSQDNLHFYAVRSPYSSDTDNVISRINSETGASEVFFKDSEHYWATDVMETAYGYWVVNGAGGWDAEAGTKIRAIRILNSKMEKTAEFNAVCANVSENGRYLMVAQRNQANTGYEIKRLDFSNFQWDLAETAATIDGDESDPCIYATADGDRVFWKASNTVLSEHSFSQKQGQDHDTSAFGFHGAFRFALVDDHRILYSDLTENRIVLFDLSSKSIEKTFSGLYPFTGNGDYTQYRVKQKLGLFSINTNQKYVVYDFIHDKFVYQADFNNGIERINNTEDKITLMDSSAQIAVYDGGNFSKLASHHGSDPGPGNQSSLSVSGDGETYLYRISSAETLIYNSVTGTRKSFVASYDGYQGPTLSRDGKHLVFTLFYPTYTSVLFTADGQQVATLDGAFHSWSPAGDRMLLRGQNGQYQIYDLSLNRTVNLGLKNDDRVHWINNSEVMDVYIDNARMATVLVKVNASGQKQEIPYQGYLASDLEILFYDAEHEVVIAQDRLGGLVQLHSLVTGYQERLLELANLCAIRGDMLVKGRPLVVATCQNQTDVYSFVP